MPDPVNSKNPDTIKAVAAALAEAKLDAMLGVGTFLSAEEMFAFAQAQLKDTDVQIKTLVNSINAAKEKAATLQEISAELRQVKASTQQEQSAKLDELIKKADAEGAQEIEDKLVQWKELVDKNTGKTDGDTIEGYAQEVDTLMTELTSSNELTMIKIQGLMQHRSQILQLASNVIAALNEPAKNAIGNLRG